MGAKLTKPKKHALPLYTGSMATIQALARSGEDPQLSRSGRRLRKVRSEPTCLSSTELNRLVAVIRRACQFEPTPTLISFLENSRSAIGDYSLVLLGGRCSYFLTYLCEALLNVVGHQFTMSPISVRAQFLVADILQLLLTKISTNSAPLTDQLLAILAQSVFSLKSLKPIEGTEPEFLRFGKLASINVSKRLLPRRCFEELFVVCASEYVQCLVDIIFHYCCHSHTSGKLAASSSVLQCLAIFGDKELLDHFYLQDWGLAELP